MIRTFVDSGVLIAAARGDHAESEPALRMLEDPDRQLLTSVFVRLEVYPKAAFHTYALQRAFLNEFFMDPSLEWARDLNGLVNLAISESERHGLAAMDALHLAAALLLGADELVTTEKPGKPIYRMSAFRVVHISNFQPT
jgi:predicted nucleic acid-binding protein